MPFLKKWMIQAALVKGIWPTNQPVKKNAANNAHKNETFSEWLWESEKGRFEVSIVK